MYVLETELNVSMLIPSDLRPFPLYGGGCRVALLSIVPTIRDGQKRSDEGAGHCDQMLQCKLTRPSRGTCSDSVPFCWGWGFLTLS